MRNNLDGIIATLPGKSRDHLFDAIPVGIKHLIVGTGGKLRDEQFLVIDATVNKYPGNSHNRYVSISCLKYCAHLQKQYFQLTHNLTV